jgi:hypothetical protein
MLDQNHGRFSPFRTHLCEYRGSGVWSSHQWTIGLAEIACRRCAHAAPNNPNRFKRTRHQKRDGRRSGLSPNLRSIITTLEGALPLITAKPVRTLTMALILISCIQAALLATYQIAHLQAVQNHALANATLTLTQVFFLAVAIVAQDEAPAPRSHGAVSEPTLVEG